RSLIVVAIDVVEHPDVRHPPLGMRAVRPLLTYACRIETHVRTRPAVGVPLPVPTLLLTEGGSCFEQLLESLSRVLRHSLDGRLTYFESAQLLERDFTRLREAGLQASDAHHLTSRRAQRAGADTERGIARTEAPATLAAMVVVS